MRNVLISGLPGGVDTGDIRGNSAGFADLCRQFLARDGALDRFCTSETRYTGKTCGICNIAAISKMKDPDRGTGYYR